jgi:hypothetical protein
MKISNSIKKSLNIASIEKIKASIVGNDEKKFRATMELAPLFASALAWYNADGKGLLIEANEGVKINVDTFCVEVLKFTKSWVYKVIKASEHDEATIEQFIDVVKQLNINGHVVDMSLQNLNKFAKDKGQFVEVNSVLEDTSEGEGEETTEGEGEGEGEETSKGDTIFTMAWKRNDVNVSLRVDANGQFITNNAPEHLAEAIEFLQGILAEFHANMEA